MNRPIRHQAMVLLGWMVLGCLGTGTAGAEPRFDLPADPDFLVVRYDQVHGIVGDSDNVLQLRIYGDGRVEIHLPFYLRRAGDYTLQLTRPELQQQLVQFDGHGVVASDPDRIRERLQQAEAARQAREGTLIGISDATRTEIEIAVRRYTPAGGGPAVADLRWKLSWRALQTEAMLYPELAELRALAAAEKALLALLKRRDLVRKSDGRIIRIGE